MAKKNSPALPDLLALGAIRAFYRAGFALLPGFTARRAARLFLKPQRRAPRHLPEPAKPATPFMVDGRIAAWSYGAGPTVLAVHGWEDDHRSLSPLIDRLAAAGYRVVTLDLPAHGRSSGELGPIPELARAVALVAETAGPLEAIVAHSLGGTAAMIAMTEHGIAAKRAVILASPNHPEHFARQAARLLQFRETDFTRMRAAIEQIAKRPMQALHLPPLLRRLNLPALFLHDPEDRVVPFRHSEENVDAWRGARLETVSGLGHRRILSDPAVIDRVLAFVSGTAVAKAA